MASGSTPENSTQPPAPKKEFFKSIRDTVTRYRNQFNKWALVSGYLVRTVREFTEYLAGLARGTKGLETAICDPKTPEEFEKNLDLITKQSGLDKFYGPGNSLLKAVAKEAARLRNDPNNRLNLPEQLDALVNVALYKLVLYCDDSTSMAGPSAIRGKTRMHAQTDLVNKIAEIATRALPEEMRRVHLQFINRTQQLDDFIPSELPGKMNFDPNGATQLGTSLKNRILTPLVYDVLNDGKPLLRPYLVLTITDGCPSQENHLTFQAAVQEAKDYVANKGYDKAAVQFDLSQVGDDKSATSFLKGLTEDTTLQGVLHIRTEHLDTQFNKFRGSEAELENFLLDRLKGPIKFRNDSKKDK